jgi:two-component system, sensor histidine kinase and response regulator
MPLVLIVDDESYQRTLIRETLSSDPTLTFAEAGNGQKGLEQVFNTPPDVILLDVMMPVMNGFQVCHRIKNDPQFRAIPVILVTALGRVEDKVAGLDAGADDFVNKPFEESELQARVRSALRAKALHDELEASNRLRDNLVKMIMHDMGNMVSVISSALAIVERIPPGSPESEPFIRDANDANATLADMINDALDLSRLEAHNMPIRREQTDIVAILETFIERFHGAAMANDVELKLDVDERMNRNVSVDKGLFQRVIGNLLTNALKYTPENSTITVVYGSGEEPNTLRLAVSDQGPGIPPEILPIVFDKYAQAKFHEDRQSRPGRGLGMTFSRLAVEAHNGKIWVESAMGQGSTFFVEMPCA